MLKLLMYGISIVILQDRRSSLRSKKEVHQSSKSLKRRSRRKYATVDLDTISLEEDTQLDIHEEPLEKVCV